MTQKEIKLVKEGDINQPMRVLLVTDEQDLKTLRKKSKNIRNEEIKDNPDLQYFIQRLTRTLDEEMGVGIAAPQVGVNVNLFLFVRLDKPDYPVQVAINPKITGHSKEMICFEDDGCLSIPDFSGNSKRWTWVDVEYRNEKGELIKERLEGYSRKDNFTGIIFQHEFDHLQGVLFTDKLCD
ncbi:peptide deformylase [Dysgonomonas sp. 520]|uniref:peptide deformylase n=1 Tax=Dysgonomonas sp. 520 TaxID=2302931 RepID=UPI0013D7F042|nr:peptide deformylase [Dysgonomonas sp. 520]NDW08593.1 peptide deformylase [Dysgonomonas sp. 520]